MPTKLPAKLSTTKRLTSTTATKPHDTPTTPPHTHPHNQIRWLQKGRGYTYAQWRESEVLTECDCRRGSTSGNKLKMTLGLPVYVRPAFETTRENHEMISWSNTRHSAVDGD